MSGNEQPVNTSGWSTTTILRVGVATAEMNTLKGRVLLDLTFVANDADKARGRPRGSCQTQQTIDKIVMIRSKLLSSMFLRALLTRMSRFAQLAYK